MKKGISMITLMITILVLAIITGIVVLNVSDTDLINNATETVNKYNERQYEIYELVKNTQEELEELVGRKKEIIYNGSLTGTNGVIELPLLLNDTSKQYILDIESNMYTGQVLLNTYGLVMDSSTNATTYIGATGINTTSNYAIEIRPLVLALQGDATQEAMTAIFGTADIQPISYYSDGTAATLSYNLANIGSEVTITRITKVEREYTMFAKLIANMGKGQGVSSYDMKEALLHCINSNLLGYDFLNEELESDSSVNESLRFNEALEMQTLKNIVNARVRDLTDIEYSVTDQILFYMTGYLQMVGFQTLDFYTFANTFEENEWLNEYYYRTFADTIVGFTVLYSDYILIDLNEDGILGGNFVVATEEFAAMLPSGNAGVMYRTYAALAATMYPIMQKYNNDMSTMTAMEQIKFEEVLHVSGYLDSSSNNMTTVSMSTYTWYAAYQLYNQAKMDTMYTLMYQNGITINMAGLKMGWNSIQSRYYMLILAQAGLSLLPPYDFRMDSDAINRQGVIGIQDQLYSYISAVQQEIEGANTNAEE